MSIKALFLSIVFIFLNVFNSAAHAELSAFAPGSYKQILAANTNRPFMLVIWSINCPTCLQDMELLSNIHKSKPELKIIMLAADEPWAREQIQQILKKYQLLDIENWAYADQNTQKLQFEIDPKWYGELPRTYFFDKAHQRTGVSGVLSKQDYDEMFTKILK